MLIIKQPSIPESQQSGFSLLEVLISLVLIAVGLLGLTGMQSTALQQNHSAYQRSLAAQLAYDIADRMRANISAIDSYSTDGSGIVALEDLGYTCSDPCTPDRMAVYDLVEWHDTLSSELPFGKATITPSLAGIYKISIQWDDNRDGVADGNDPNFVVSFQP